MLSNICAAPRSSLEIALSFLVKSCGGSFTLLTGLIAAGFLGSGVKKGGGLGMGGGSGSTTGCGRGFGLGTYGTAGFFSCAWRPSAADLSKSKIFQGSIQNDLQVVQSVR